MHQPNFFIEKAHIQDSRQLVSNLEDIDKQENPFQTSYKIDPRDSKIVIKFKEMSLLSSEFNEQDQRIVRKWLSKVYEVVSGDSFMKLYQGDLSMDQTKSYVTKNYLMNIHQFMRRVKRSQLRAKKLKVFEFINEQSKTIIGFLKDKFPQTQQVGSNQYLTKVVSKINYSGQIQYDLLFQNKQKQSGQPRILLEFRQDKNYNSEIMLVLNYLIGIARMPFKLSQIDNRKLAGSLIKSMLKIQASKKYDFDGQHYHLTLMKAFQLMLQSIFTNNKALFDQIDKKQIKSKDDFVNFFFCDQQSSKTIDFALGHKLSEKIDTYTQQEIKSGSIAIRNTAVLRVITKWVQQLRETLRDSYEKFIVNNKFVSQKGQILIFSKQTRKVMYQVVQEQQRRIKQVFKQIEHIYLKNEQEIFEFEASQFYLNPLDTNLSVLAGRTQVCIGRYMLIYLNEVIHSLLSVPIRTVEKLQNDTRFRLPQIERRKILSLNLITCKLSDLLRGKCKSNESDIIAIYKFIEKMSQKHPEIVKLIKVKDRLNTPNKDISLNFMFMQKVVCELQLVTAASALAAKDKKSYLFNSFNHLLYELQRAQFGPIAQSAYIAAKYDPMINKNAAKIEQMELKNLSKLSIPAQLVKIESSKPKNKKESNLLLPFICERCKKLKEADNQSFIPKKKNKYCNQCTLETIHKENFKTFISILLRNQGYTQQQLVLLANVLVLVNPAKIKKIEDIQLGFLTLKNTNLPTSILFRTAELDGQLHMIASSNSSIKTSIPIVTISLRDKGSRKKAISKLNNYYILAFRQEYVKQKPPSPELFHDKLQQDVVIFCHCKNEEGCILNLLQRQQFPMERFRSKINLKVYDQCLQKMSKRLYMQERKISNEQFNKYAYNTQVQQAQLDRNRIQSINVIQNFAVIRRLLLDNNKIKSFDKISQSKTLKQLSVSKNQLQSLEGIQKFQNLEILFAQGNKIVELPTFANNLKIQRLAIDRNKIQKLIFVTKLPCLIYLSCLPDKDCQAPKRLSEVQFGDNIPNLQTLNIQIAQYVWLKPIQKMKKMKSIFCVDSNWLLSLRNFVYIGKCESLQRVQINNCDLQELDWMKGLRNLIFLDISNNKIKSLQIMTDYQNLVNLQCSDNQITEMANPSAFPNLKFLYMNKNKLKSIIFIHLMPNLECFEADQNMQIDNSCQQQADNAMKNLIITSLAKKDYANKKLQLNKLFIGKNKISDTRFINKFPQLINFQARFNLIQQFQTTSDNINISELDLQFNHIKIFKVVNQMPNLRKINLHQNKIEKLDIQFALQYLKQFNISNNMLTDLSVLQKMPNLEDLNCNQNRITSLNLNFNGQKTLPIFKTLKKLYISRNKLTTLKEVNKFISIEFLYVNNNELQVLQLDENMNKLISLQIHANLSLRSLKDLNKIKSLQILNCSMNQIQELFDNHPNIQELKMDIRNQNQIANIKMMKKLRKVELHCAHSIAQKLKKRITEDLAKRLQVLVESYIMVPPPNKKECVTCKVQFSQDPKNPNYLYYWRYWHEDKDLQCRNCFESATQFNKAILLNSTFKGQFNATVLGRATTAKIRLNEMEKEGTNSQIFPYYICGICKQERLNIRYICLIEGKGQNGFADYCDQCLGKISEEEYLLLQNKHRRDHPLLRMRHNYFYSYGRQTGYYYY